MMDEKRISAVSTIQRAMGIIEGLAAGMDEGARTMAYTAVEMIDEAVEVLK